MRKIRADLHSNMPFFGMRVPTDLLNYVEKLSRQARRTKSDIARSLIVEALIARGVVEPASDIEVAE